MGRADAPFCPPIQRLGRSYRGMKSMAALALLLGAAWIFEGRALCRRLLFPVDAVSEAARTSGGFVALCFPRLTTDGRRLTVRASDFEAVLAALRKEGWITIGLRDVEDFYRKGRALPPKALLLAFDRDDAGTMELADAALKEARMRAVVFINKPPPDQKGAREALSPHAVRQMVKSGAWDLGWVAEHEPRWRRGDPIRPAVLDLGDSKYAWTRNPYRYPIRFIASRSGYNDAGRMPWALRLHRVRTDKRPEDVVRLVTASLPRTRAFEDDFERDGLALDWVAERGVVVAIGGRLVLVPTPKQKSASAHLSGTEAWRDCVLEWELKKYRRNGWVYARASEKEDRWVRFGAMNGYWYLQQKVGAEKKPRTLARAPMSIVTSLPARVRLVLKGPWAIVHVNGRMQFGKAVRVHSGIDRGRVELDVYDEKPAAALAVVGSFAAAPLSAGWLGVEREALAGDPDAEVRLLEVLRERAVFAAVLTPRWLEVLADGRVSAVDEDREFARSLAGYYRCALVPMLDFASPEARLPEDRAGADRMLEEIMAALRGTEAAGLNIRLSARRPGEETHYLLGRLRARLHEGRRRLYITVDGTSGGQPWLRLADGVLRASERPWSPAPRAGARRHPPGGNTA
jgi:peptidoglycan/xylan/chitin deacetylase (PgdA/CDA1 family)